MLEESLQSSVNAVKRAMRHKFLPEINKHLAKMVKKSAVRILTKTDMEKIIRGEIKVNFLARNFTEKGTSASTNVRFLADTARPIPHADGKTLSSVTAGPKGDINDLVKSGTIFHLNQRHVETDLSSAYWSIRIAESVGMLTLSVWFHQPEEYGTDQPVMMLPTAKEFGIGDSGSALKSAVEKFVVPELKDDPFLANIVACYGYVDNFPVTSPSNTKEETLLNVIKTKKAFSKFGLDLNKTFTPHHMLDNKEDSPVDTNLYGLNWNLEDDTCTPLFELNVHKKVKGRVFGKNLEEEDLDPMKITTRDIGRLTSEIYSVTGRDVSPSSHSARLLLSTCCMLNKTNDIDLAVHSFSPETAAVCVQFFHGLCGIKKRPIQRYCVPDGYVINHLVIDHDGSDTGLGTSIRVVSFDKTDTNKRTSYILGAKSISNVQFGIKFRLGSY